MASHAVAWVKEDPFGVEYAEIEIVEKTPHRGRGGRRHRAAPVPARLRARDGHGVRDDAPEGDERGDGWRRELDLRRDGDGVWHCATREEGLLDLPPAGGETAGLVAALDCDLGLSPVTNMMPILRHGLLHSGGPIELTMAWVAVPALTVHADGQRYAHISAGPGGHVVRYEATDGSFTADITIDADAVVIDYPGIARRLTAPSAP